MLIVSAGIYELIDQSLRLFESNVEGDDFSSIKILSNEFSFDEQTGRVNGYLSPLIHSGNKAQMIYEESEHRIKRNAIVMGDIVEDATMVRDRKHGTVLRIGFLNTSNDELKLQAF